MTHDSTNREALKKMEVLLYLHLHVFDPILDSPSASETLKKGIRFTISRMEGRDAKGIVHFYWSAVIGTERSTEFARQMRQEGFTRFEEIIEDFRNRFNDKWIRS
jgi:hypothetical protein